MPELPELYKKLDQYHKNFNDWDNVENFVSTAEEIAEKNNPASIPVLLRYFDDNDNTDYVYERLKGIIISYGKLYYTEVITKYLYVMLPKAKNWAIEMVYGLINNLGCLEYLRANIYLANNDLFLEILGIIYKESEKHRPIINELKKILEEND